MLPFTDQILALATEKTFVKNDFLAQESKRANFLYFLKKGLVRSFYNLDGVEITTGFALENDFVTSTSFFTQLPSRESIVALENLQVLEISRAKLYQLYEQQPETEKFGRLLAEEHLIYLETIFHHFSEKSATERYQIFEKLYPTLLQRVPLGYLASFLDMSQETLSRIRAKKN
jgi:CRP-like cAMP-binding protein